MRRQRKTIRAQRLAGAARALRGRWLRLRVSAQRLGGAVMGAVAGMAEGAEAGAVMGAVTGMAEGAEAGAVMGAVAGMAEGAGAGAVIISRIGFWE